VASGMQKYFIDTVTVDRLQVCLVSGCRHRVNRHQQKFAEVRLLISGRDGG
jgi:hypothetical protein